MLLNLHCQPGLSLCVGMQIHCKQAFNTFIGTNHSIYTEQGCTYCPDQTKSSERLQKLWVKFLNANTSSNFVQKQLIT